MYPTNEHYYQSMKAHNVEVRAWIRAAPSPWLAMKAGDSLRNKEVSDGWDKEKFAIMKKGLLAKFRDPYLKKMLLETGNKGLHERNPDDPVLGFRGKDMLGKLLMEVRAELRGQIDDK